MNGRGILPLAGRRARNSEHSGGKAATLARLDSLGFSVPPGFVICPSVLDGLARRCAVGLHGPEAGPEEFEALFHELLECPVPEAGQRLLRRAFRRFGPPVAVRSSFVGEDGVRDSYAGQLESVLGVADEEAFIAAVRLVYASQFRGRLAHYRLARGRSGRPAAVDDGTMAVLVQRMIEPVAAGVAFSADPVSGRRRVIIEATAGRGERVADGSARPQRHVVDARGVLVGSEDGDDGAALEPDRVLELASLVRRIEAALGGPQDVEWAWDGSRFHVLQARPITSLAGRHIYSRRLLADMSPGLVTPLQWSTTTRSMVRHVFGKLFCELLGRRDLDPTRLITRLRSRIYGDMTLLGELLAEAGLPVNFFEMLARDERAAHLRPRPTIRAAGRAPRITWCTVRWLRMARPAGRCLAEVRQTLDRLGGAEEKGADPEKLLRDVDELLELHGRLQWNTVLGAMNLMLRSKMLRRLVGRWAPGVDQRDLLGGSGRGTTLGWNFELEAMAVAARGLGEELTEAMVGGDDRGIRRRLEESPAGRELAASMDGFLERYGFLSSDGTDLSSPSWREQPSVVWATVGRLAATPRKEPPRDVVAGRLAAQQRALSPLGPARRAVLRRVWQSTERHLDLRERLGLRLAESAHRLRGLFLALGFQLVAEDVLKHPEEVFLLYWDEVRALCEGSLDVGEARELVGRRFDELESDAAWDVEDTFCGLEGARDRPQPQGPAPGCLSGIGSSPGSASGRACVLRDPTAAPTELHRELILVVPFTDVGWTPLLSLVGGVVAESGGILSHTSIIAREYGLPAVVNVERATTLIRDGEQITVDGDHGRVCFDDRRTGEGSTP